VKQKQFHVHQTQIDISILANFEKNNYLFKKKNIYSEVTINRSDI